MADRLAPQDGLYTLVERAPAGDTFEIIGSIACASSGERVTQLADRLADPQVAIVTLTITEAGYRLAVDGSPDLDDPVVSADLESLRTIAEGAPLKAVPQPATALGRLLAGLEARRRAQSGPLAVVPCDNLPDNGGRVRAALMAMAESKSPRLASWLDENVAVVSTSVDRITPRANAADADAVVAATGLIDAAPVITEPFSDWVLCGEFPSGRPDWESSGARFVSDIAPYETRKLWLLNGAHSLLSFLGPIRGHTTVAEAIDDTGCRAAVERLWDEAARHLAADELGLPAYREALVQRFRNPRIEHRLEQIAMDGLTKIRLRILPVARAELSARATAPGCAIAAAAWITAVRSGRVATDTLTGVDGARINKADSDRALLAVLDSDLAADERFWGEVDAALRELKHTLLPRGS
jgi:fructuronate reductase